jgi:phospholipase D1/2
MIYPCTDQMQVLIADDRVVICGSANLNDRSQLGTHDSEIAIIIEDPTTVQSSMAGRPWQASRFAASLRRQLFRKHLGLVGPQDMQRPDENFDPVGVPNRYDWGSPEDTIVADPLSDAFQSLWNSRAKTNTEIFRKVFHAVPDDTVRNWNAYKEFYEYYFHQGDPKSDQKKNEQKPARYMWGHVVRDDFSPGAAGVKEVKEQLSRVKGTLVEMPLMFLIEEDIAQEGASLNALTEELYT